MLNGTPSPISADLPPHQIVIGDLLPAMSVNFKLLVDLSCIGCCIQLLFYEDLVFFSQWQLLYSVHLWYIWHDSSPSAT